MVCFYDLPIEIRDKIYGLSTGDGDKGSVLAAPQWYHQVWDERERANMALLRTSRPIRTEFARVLGGCPWLVTPDAGPALARHAPEVRSIVVELHYLDGLGSPACLQQMQTSVGRGGAAADGGAGPGGSVGGSKMTQRTATHNGMKEHIMNVWLHKFEVAMKTGAEHVRVDATSASCINGCCRLVLEWQRHVNHRYDADEVFRNGKKIRAKMARSHGRTIEFEGVQDEYEASRILNVVRLVSNRTDVSPGEAEEKKKGKKGKEAAHEMLSRARSTARNPSKITVHLRPLAHQHFVIAEMRTCLFVCTRHQPLRLCRPPPPPPPPPPVVGGLLSAAGFEASAPAIQLAMSKLPIGLAALPPPPNGPCFCRFSNSSLISGSTKHH